MTGLRIGELLLSRGVCSREQLREAWEQKVLYGDRLGTNLLSLGHIDEATLAQSLGAQLGVHSGHGKVLNPQPEALKLIPKNVAEKRQMVPHHVADRALFLLMRDPHDANAINEARFASGMKVVPVVVCEARIWQLLERHYLARMSMRPIPLDGIVRTRPKPVFEDETASIGMELVSEEEFQRLYAGMMTPQAAPVLDVEEAAPAAFTPTTPARPSVKGPGQAPGFLAPPRTGADDDGPADDRPYALITDDEEQHEWRDTIEKTSPMVARARTSEVQSSAGSTLPVIDLVELVPDADELRPQRTLDFAVDVDEPIEETPLDFAEATRLLQSAKDRTAIARVVLRAARTKFARACLLTVYTDRILGWQGIGEGVESEKISTVVIPRATKSVFQLVADSRSHYLGPLARWPAHGAWVKATGRQIPKSVAVFPILVRGKPVNLLYVDAGHNAFVSSDVGEVLILAQQIAKTYETLLSTG